jgi:hypothetical protein
MRLIKQHQQDASKLAEGYAPATYYEFESETGVIFYLRSRPDCPAFPKGEAVATPGEGRPLDFDSPEEMLEFFEKRP